MQPSQRSEVVSSLFSFLNKALASFEVPTPFMDATKAVADHTILLLGMITRLLGPGTHEMTARHMEKFLASQDENGELSVCVFARAGAACSVRFSLAPPLINSARVPLLLGSANQTLP